MGDDDRDDDTETSEPQRSSESARDPRSKRGSKKSIHSVENTANQVPHQEFAGFCEDYFEEIDAECFERLVLPTEIDDDWLCRIAGLDGEYEEHHSILVRSLAGCLVEESMDGGDAEGGGEPEFFVENKVLDAFSNGHIERLAEMYRRQATTNNSRRRVLGEALRERLVYPAYYNAMRMIDGEIEAMYVKKKKSKKKSDLDEDAMREVLEKRAEFYALFGEIGAQARDYEGFRSIFDAGDDVDARMYGVEPYDYFP